MEQAPQTPICFFDSKCELCTRFKTILNRLMPDGGIETFDIHDESLNERFPYLEFSELDKDLHVINSEGEVLKAAEAIDYLIQIIPACRPFLWLINVESRKAAGKLFHDVTDKLRKRLHKHCTNCR